MVSPPVRSEPALVSVVIPARDAEESIGEQLDALTRQTYEGAWEVLVIDNGSRDGTREAAASYKDRLPGLRVLLADHGSGAAYARNEGARAARGDLLVFCDADDVVACDWLGSLVEAAQAFDAVGGRREFALLNDDVSIAWEPPRDDGLPTSLGFLPYAHTSNLAVWRDALEEVGGFPSYPGAAGEDVAFSWDLQLAGYLLGYCPQAIVHYRLRSRMSEVAGQYHAYGIAKARRYREYRVHGAKRRSVPSSVRAWLGLVRRIWYLLASREKRGWWIRAAAIESGYLRGAVRHRIWFFG